MRKTAEKEIFKTDDFEKFMEKLNEIVNEKLISYKSDFYEYDRLEIMNAVIKNQHHEAKGEPAEDFNFLWALRTTGTYLEPPADTLTAAGLEWVNGVVGISSVFYRLTIGAIYKIESLKVEDVKKAIHDRKNELMNELNAGTWDEKSEQDYKSLQKIA